jgi:serpin B
MDTDKKRQFLGTMIVCFFASLLFVVLFFSLTARAQGEPSSPYAFGLKLHREVAKDKNRSKNFVICPTGIAFALALTASGAREKTREELMSLLGGERSLSDVGQMVKTLFDRYGKKGKAEPPKQSSPRLFESSRTQPDLFFANSLWLDQQLPVNENYVEQAKDIYHADVRRISFVDQLSASETINSWARQATFDSIPAVVSPEQVNADTRMVLVSTSYMDALWRYPFDRNSTKEQPFFLLDGRTDQVKMMMGQEDLLLFEDSQLQALLLPYQGDGVLAMVVVLPRKKDGLREVEEMINASTLSRWLGGMAIRDVAIFLPKFKFDSDYNLKEMLQALGIKSAFSAEHANFEGVTEDQQLYVREFVHKSFIDVFEEGTKAGSATIGLSYLGADGYPPAEFRADHPFLFFIIEPGLNVVLFSGRVASP